METTAAPETLPCTRCNGTLQLSYGGSCSWCEAKGVNGSYAKPDFHALLQAVLATKGKNKGKVRASAPKFKWSDLVECRVYYLWRLFRFHAGQDVTMPILATMAIESDPWADQIEVMARTLAQHVTGHRSAGTMRWSGLLGTRMATMPGERLPSSAFEGGPVSDGNKPDFERLEKK